MATALASSRVSRASPGSCALRLSKGAGKRRAVGYDYVGCSSCSRVGDRVTSQAVHTFACSCENGELHCKYTTRDHHAIHSDAALLF